MLFFLETRLKLFPVDLLFKTVDLQPSVHLCETTAGNPPPLPQLEKRKGHQQVVGISSVFKISLTLFSEYSQDFI